MKQYLDILRRLLSEGKAKHPVRKNIDGTETRLSNGTIALPNVIFSHDMSNGFPLLTTKKMPLGLVAVELEGFLKGVTDKNWFQSRSCNIWNSWNSPTSDDTNDLGPLGYSWQWRKFGEQYGEVPMGEFDQYDVPLWGQANGLECGTDQLKNIVDRLHQSPHDRRMVCSGWNPNQIHMMALPPCTWGWNVTVIDNKINLAWIQRSCDFPIGGPWDIASNALLLLLLSKESGFEPGNLTGLLVDCHIYDNQIESCKIQIERTPYKLPTVDILSKDDKFSIFDWEHTDIKLNNYISHPKLEFGSITV